MMMILLKILNTIQINLPIRFLRRMMAKITYQDNKPNKYYKVTIEEMIKNLLQMTIRIGPIRN